MPKIEVSIDYLTARDRFKSHLHDVLTASDEFPNAVDIFVDVASTPRKFDRVRTCYKYTEVNPDTGEIEQKMSLWRVLFFISRSTGEIYGRKSEVAPNVNWFFGDVYSIDEWEWTSTGATPKDLTKYEKVSSYDKHVHYRRVTQKV
jgi:hypothetical protein